ncbi:MAG: class I SAM-dependent methyltransferase [Candidatus Binatia bacterium]
MLLRRASGTVLEVAVGTGKNLAHYRRDCPIIALDLSGEMLKVARNRAAKLSMHVSFLVADAEALPFPDESFDSVVSSLSTCTFPNPVAALEEIARVCRADGRVLLLERGRSERERLGRRTSRRLLEKSARRIGSRSPIATLSATSRGKFQERCRINCLREIL